MAEPSPGRPGLKNHLMRRTDEYDRLKVDVCLDRLESGLEYRGGSE